MSTTVFGIDIFKGNARSSSARPRFALVRVCDSRVESEEKNISIPRLLRLLHQERPSIMAVDSVQELAADSRELFAFMSALPSETRLVQVTGDGVQMMSLAALAGRYNLRFDASNPMEEAKVSALIASFGGGYEVLAFDGTTTVVVSRARSMGRGGWSQNRYVRKVHGGVKVRAREIAARLEEAGLSYTVLTRRAFGGESRTTFHVAAGRRDVPVSSSKSGDVQVKVVPQRRNAISFVPLTRRLVYLILGIDPGTTVGVAILDLNGNLLHLESVRAQSAAEIIAVISAIGKPLIIATDKAEMPAGVEKIRRAFSATAWTPKKDVLIKEKYAAAEGYSFNDDHQRDSLAAAVLAYRSYQPKFDNLRRRLPAGTDLDFVRAGVVRGQSIVALLAPPAVSAAADVSESSGVPADDAVPDEKDLEIIRLSETVSRLRRLAGELSADAEAKEKSIASLQRRLNVERGERETEVLVSDAVASRDSEILQIKKALRKEERRCRNLRLRLERMKHYIALQAGEGCCALKVLHLLARDHLKNMDDEMGVHDDDILYVLKIDGWGRSILRDIEEAHVKAIIFPKITYEKAQEQHLLELFRDMNVPALNGVHLSPRVKGKIGVVDEGAFLRALDEWNAAEAVYLKGKQSEAINGMVTEYQVTRKKEVMEQGIDASTFEYNQKPAAPPKKMPRPKFEPKPTPAPKPAAPVSIPVPAYPPLPEPEPAPEPAARDILFGVLAEYRTERKKELEKNDG